MQADDEGTVYQTHDLPLIHCAAHEVLVPELGFVDLLHREEFAVAGFRY